MRIFEFLFNATTDVVIQYFVGVNELASPKYQRQATDAVQRVLLEANPAIMSAEDLGSTAQVVLKGLQADAPPDPASLKLVSSFLPAIACEPDDPGDCWYLENEELLSFMRAPDDQADPEFELWFQTRLANVLAYLIPMESFSVQKPDAGSGLGVGIFMIVAFFVFLFVLRKAWQGETHAPPPGVDVEEAAAIPAAAIPAAIAPVQVDGEVQDPVFGIDPGSVPSAARSWLGA